MNKGGLTPIVCILVIHKLVWKLDIFISGKGRFYHLGVLYRYTKEEVFASSHQSMEKAQLEELIADIKQGNTARYALIVKMFQQPLYRYCYRLLANRQDAEDAVQDILVKAFQSIRQYESKVHFSAWIYRIAYNYCMNLLRKRRIHKQVLRLIQSKEAGVSPEQEIDDKLHHSEWFKALMHLTIEERNLIVLRVFEEKTYAEISKILRVSPNALTKRMLRIKKKMQKTKLMMEEEMNWNDTKKIVPNSEI